jgi:hypothetical protein
VDANGQFLVNGYKSVLNAYNEKIEYSKKVSNKTGNQKSRSEKGKLIK